MVEMRMEKLFYYSSGVISKRLALKGVKPITPPKKMSCWNENQKVMHRESSQWNITSVFMSVHWKRLFPTSSNYIQDHTMSIFQQKDQNQWLFFRIVVFTKRYSSKHLIGHQDSNIPSLWGKNLKVWKNIVMKL